MLSWLLGYWSILVWAIPILIGCALLQFYLGPRFSWPASAVGLGFIILLFGKKIERDNNKKYVQDIQEKRKKAYEKIDSRHTDRDDVLDRLRDGGF